LDNKQSLLSRIIRKRIIIMLLLLIFEIAVFAVLSTPNSSIAEVFAGKSIFLKTRNFSLIINSIPITVFLTIGITLLMISGKLDLSTGANGTLCAMALASLLRGGMPLAPAILIALLIGIVIGFVNAALVNELRVAPFIGTLATSSIAAGITYYIANKVAIEVVDPILKELGRRVLWNFMPLTALIAITFMIIAGIVLHWTGFGRKIYLVGGNPHAAMLSGINHRRMSYALFMVCGLFSAIAGVVFVARQQSANMAGISAARFQGITAAVLGGIAFGGGTGGMAGAFVGILVLNTFTNGLNLVPNTNPQLQYIANGLLLIFALTLDYMQTQQSKG